MKGKVFASLLLVCLPWLAMAQSNDDLYFIPKKEKKWRGKKRSVRLRRRFQIQLYMLPRGQQL